MTEVQFDIYKEFIDEEIELGNFEDIQKIIDYTIGILKAQKTKKSIEMYTISDEDFYNVYDILNQSFLTFSLENNIEGDVRKPLYNSFYLENIAKGNLISNADDLKVYHTLGLPYDEMIIDTAMLDIYEHVLNSKGLSIYTTLSSSQLLELKQKTKVKK